MAKISALPTLDAIAGDEQLPAVKNGRTVRVALRALAIAMVPFLQAYYKGDKGDPGAAGNVAVGRAYFKNRPAVVGDVWELVDGAKSGTFDIIAAPPAGTKDPDEGLFIPLANGRWASRRIILNVYEMAWWGIGNGFRDTAEILAIDAGAAGTISVVQGRTFYHMANLLPDGSELWYPPAAKATPILKASATQWGQKSVRLWSRRGTTWVSTYAGSACFNDGDGFERFNGSNSGVFGVCYENLRTTQGQISPSCIAFGGGVFPNRRGNPIVNVGYEDCVFENVSAPCIAYECSWSRTDPDGLQYTRGFFARRSVVDGCDYEYQSCYGIDGGVWEDMAVRCDFLGLAREFYGFRILGTRNFTVRGRNTIIGPGYGRGDARCFTVAMAVHPVNGAAPIPAENITIEAGTTAYNWPLFGKIGGKVENLLIREPRILNTTPPTDQTAPYPVLAFELQDNQDIGLVRIERPYIRGYDGLLFAQYGWIRRLDMIEPDFESVGRDSQPTTGLFTMRSVDGMLRWQGGRMMYPLAYGSPIRFPNPPDTFHAEVTGVVLPEHGYGPDDSRRAKAISASGNTGTYVTSPGGAVQTPFEDRVLDDGTNRFSSAGTWARLQRDPKPGV